MPRRPRLFLADVAAHVVQRGVDRSVCFRSDNDRILYLLHLQDRSAATGCAVHAYCLMTNHVHLLVTPSSTEGCQAMMKGLGQRYAQYFNRTYGRSGPLWDGRYYACVAESSFYVLACYRYIELNPVRAGLVARPNEYAWSSYRANAEGRNDRLTTPHPEYLALGLGTESRLRAYCRLFGQALDSSLIGDIRASTIGGYPLASDRFKAEIEARGAKLGPETPGPKPRRPARSGSDPDL
jgi:putative transposase